MKYYLCLIGNFDGADKILEHCLNSNVYQYHEDTRQKGAGGNIVEGDTIILGYKKNNQILAYGITLGCLGEAVGYEEGWMAVNVQQWIKTDENQCFALPYGVFWHTLVGNKQSVVKEIDSLLANELIYQITLRNKKQIMPSKPAIYMHLSTIATFFQKGLISMPAVQRGKVWNAVRVEVLWDSILRGFSIGSMCARPIDGEQCKWELLDGQQRVNAINLGFEDISTEDSASILWLDLAHEETEQNDGKVRGSDRKYFFRVTTPAHPWGYKLSDNETRNSLLSAEEKRKALHAIKLSDKSTQKPKTYDLWPIDAKFPVPFFDLREFFEGKPEGSFEDFWNFCRKKRGKSNWFLFFDTQKDEFFNSVGANWNNIQKAIEMISSKVVVIQNLSYINDDDVGLYFKRLNKAGVVPNDEEIRYSLLKSKCPALKELDKIAEQRMPPAAMADIAMLSFLTQTQNNKKWNFNVKDHIAALAKDESFRNYVKDKGELYKLISAMENRILYKYNPLGIPQYLLSSIALSHRGLYRLLLFFQKRWNCEICIEKLVALVTLVCWFGSDKMMSYGYEIFNSMAPCNNWDYASRRWLFTAIQRGDMIPPPPVCYFDVFDSCLNKSNWQDDVMQKIGCSSYVDGINCIWSWESKGGRALLLYACRNYIQKEFPDYDPSDAVWSEENRPWDYDHIFPKSWLITGRGNRQGKYHNIVAKFIHSIGNIAPIHFSKNRQKNAEFPGNYMEDDNNLLFVDYDKNKEFFSNDSGKGLEGKEEFAKQFVEITMSRFCKLYRTWYKTLTIDSLFDYKDKRRILFESIRLNLKSRNIESEVFFTCSDGRQYECKCNADWARQWLAIGFYIKDEQTVFPAVAANKDSIEIGLRRHPNMNSINGDSNKWYAEPHVSKSLNVEEEKIDELASSLSEQICVLGRKLQEGVRI